MFLHIPVTLSTLTHRTIFVNRFDTAVLALVAAFITTVTLWHCLLKQGRKCEHRLYFRAADPTVQLRTGYNPFPCKMLFRTKDRSMQL